MESLLGSTRRCRSPSGDALQSLSPIERLDVALLDVVRRSSQRTTGPGSLRRLMWRSTIPPQLYAREVAASDTSAAVRRIRDDAYRAMTAEQRVDLAVQLSEEVRAITIAGIRSRDPAIEPSELRHRFMVVLHGRALADEILGVQR